MSANQNESVPNNLTLYHTLTETDFAPENAPQTIEPWSLPQPVNRTRWLHFMIHSFGISQGVPEAQAMFMRRTRALTRFDVVSSVRAFRNAGSWNCLSEEERAIFFEAFSKVSKHLYVYSGLDLESKIREELANLPVATLATEGTKIDYATISEDDFHQEMKRVIRSFQQNRLANLYG